MTFAICHLPEIRNKLMVAFQPEQSLETAPFIKLSLQAGFRF